MSDLKTFSDIDSECNKAYLQGKKEVEDKILSIMDEFGTMPTECLSIIGEYIDLAQHFRAYPNAPDPETQNL